jgi:hypothetical protein
VSVVCQPAPALPGLHKAAADKLASVHASTAGNLQAT